MLESLKEVVDSRVESRVGNKIAWYFFNSLQINVMFVFSYFEIRINQVKISKTKNPYRYEILFAIFHLYSHYSPYKSKRTVRWDRQSKCIENVHNKGTKNINPPSSYRVPLTTYITHYDMKLKWARESVYRRVPVFKKILFCMQSYMIETQVMTKLYRIRMWIL